MKSRKLTVKFLLMLAMCMPGVKMLAQVNTVQPTIMVVPFTKEGEDIRRVLEDDVQKRAVLTSIKEAFDNRGFTTVDFLGKMRATSNQAAFNQGTQTDLVTEIVQNSGADIYITAEIDINKNSQGTAINIIMTGYDSSTGASLANKIGNSGRFYTDDLTRLSDVAIKKNMDTFLDNLQTKFNDIVANGRSIIVDVKFDEDSAHSMDEDFDGELLSDLIEMWMEDNAYKNYAHIAGTTNKGMLFDDVKIPLKDPTNGRNYNINRFASSFQKYLKSLGLDVKRQSTGNQLYITIQ